jgi:ankyrin repeat protein
MSEPDYQAEANQLLANWQCGDPAALEFFHAHLPRFRRDDIRWLPKDLTKEQLKAEQFTEADARAAIASRYDFANTEALDQYAAAMASKAEPLYSFELAVDAVVNGDLPLLQKLLNENPNLVHQRSTRLCPFDPPLHAATLLIYLAANGTENYRQKTPPNAVEIATLLLDRGADPNAEANLYGGKCATLGLLISSSHPAKAGLQIPLAELLIARGANHEGGLDSAIAHGHLPVAKRLAELGATVDLPAAAALGQINKLRDMLPTASPEQRHRALALAAQSGETESVRILLDAGEDPNRFNPPGAHQHTPPLHQTIWANHLETAKLLVERGARLDICDTIYNSTPLGWARYAGRTEFAAWLESLNAP